nr:putative gamma-glutamylcyclotransferase At3g02910 [Tanacetum cinerariifolium]
MNENDKVVKSDKNVMKKNQKISDEKVRVEKEMKTKDEQRREKKVTIESGDTTPGLKQLDMLEGVTLGHYERLPVGLRQVGGGGKGVVVMAEAYFGHRSFAQEMWRRSGEVGFQCFDQEMEKGYVRRDLRPKY